MNKAIMRSHKFALTIVEQRAVRALADQFATDSAESLYLERAMRYSIEQRQVPPHARGSLEQSLSWLRRHYQQGTWTPEQALFGDRSNQHPSYRTLRQQLSDQCHLREMLNGLLARPATHQLSVINNHRTCQLRIKNIQQQLSNYQQEDNHHGCE